MNFKNNITRLYKNPYILFSYLGGKGYFKWMSDELYLKLFYRGKMGKALNLENPVTFNEKLQWLKINNRNPHYTMLVDKYSVREYVKNNIGEEYLVPLLGVYDTFEDIDFNELPNEFVLKTTHDSGGVVVCRDKEKLNLEEVKTKINKSLKRKFYYRCREWPYKNIQPRIICEAIIKTKDNRLPIDYKFHCFNGKPDNVMICTERDTGNPKFFFFNKNWNLLKYNISGKNADKNFTLEKPKMMDKMFELSKVLSKDLPFSRIDLYCEDDKIYFGEITLYPDAGFDSNLLTETDKFFGDLIEL